MFGIYRTMLALWVMIFHLLSVPIIGPYAVFSFFVLSGFLMTTIMHESYGYDKEGRKRYTFNRFLRLYPMYWAAIVVSIVVITVVSSEYSGLYKKELAYPDDIGSVLFNFTMLFPALFPNEISPRLSPPTWALTLEIFFYICIGLGLSKTRRIVKVWLGASIIYYVFSYIFGLDDKHRYFSIFAASLPFSVGSALYFYKQQCFDLLRKLKFSNPYFLLVLYILNAGIFAVHEYYWAFDVSYFIGQLGIYLNILLSVLVISSLYYRGSEISSKKADKIIGDYSYPIYLIHWQCGLLACWLLYETPIRGMSFEGVIVFALALVFVVVISSLLNFLIDKNVSIVRDKIKSNGIRFRLSR